MDTSPTRRTLSPPQTNAQAQPTPSTPNPLEGIFRGNTGLLLAVVAFFTVIALWYYFVHYQPSQESKDDEDDDEEEDKKKDSKEAPLDKTEPK